MTEPINLPGPDPEPLGVYPEAAPQHPPAAPREFKAWHKPRKQWVREFQWRDSIGAIIDEVNFRDGRPFRYLTLPGEDLLDVRVVQAVCRAKGIPFKYLGFTTKDPEVKGTQLNISVNEVAALEGVSPASRVTHNRFEMLANKASMASSYAAEYGPFDAINIDLCDSLASPRQDPGQADPTYYEGLHRLIELQVQNHSDPWLLLLTTRADPGSVSQRYAESLWDCVNENITASAGFRAELERLLDFNVESVIRDKHAVMGLPAFRFAKLFGVAVGKWILKTVSRGRPPWKMVPGKLAHYRVGGGDPDMLSLVFRFERVNPGLRDAANLVRASYVAPVEEIDEKQLALGVLAGCSASNDIDALLGGDAVLRAGLVDRSAALMASARYSPDAYRAWVAQ